MSILTTQVSDGDYRHEIMNDSGVVVAQLTDEMFVRLKKEGMSERVVKLRKSTWGSPNSRNI